MGDINIGVNQATTEVGNGVGNLVLGGASATATQTVGSDHFGFGSHGGDFNFGQNEALNQSGNGAFNQILGPVSATADQHIGSEHAGFEPGFGGLGGIPGVGDINIGVNQAFNISGNGAFNVLGPTSADAHQDIGSVHAGPVFEPLHFA